MEFWLDGKAVTLRDVFAIIASVQAADVVCDYLAGNEDNGTAARVHARVHAKAAYMVADEMMTARDVAVAPSCISCYDGQLRPPCRGGAGDCIEKAPSESQGERNTSDSETASAVCGSPLVPLPEGAASSTERDQLIHAIRSWLNWGEDAYKAGHQGGYFSGGGWAAVTLREFVERLEKEAQ